MYTWERQMRMGKGRVKERERGRQRERSRKINMLDYIFLKAFINTWHRFHDSEKAWVPRDGEALNQELLL